ncbi:uncharacterized protein [Montipora capricornis]|uniref:uncharacterized protein n=1 Tax=Montipora capricornis TaxID=246305 RepID=UPI0035F21754
MVDKRTLVKCQVALIFLWVFASANVARANENSPSKRVAEYNVRITETGEQYNETIEVDTESQTEVFKVPAHNNVEHSNVMHDFKLNLSLIKLPEEMVCYLVPLAKDLPEPGKLISDLDQNQGNDSDETITLSKWTVGKMVDASSRSSILSPSLDKFCADFPIFYAKKTLDSMEATKIQNSGKERRRRQTLCRVSYRCYRVCYSYRCCSWFFCHWYHRVYNICYRRIICDRRNVFVNEV